MQMLKFVKKEAPYWTTGTLATPAGAVYTVSTEWSRCDTWGMIKSRMSAFRMNYAITPGLYAVGGPTKDADVFVTANYKLTFDILRRELKGMNVWVLVLDTKSINVWCAAGKGTFGTDELIKRITEAKLDSVVGHRRIILPQLGAVGVNASEVQKKTGFRVSFGPIEARDIPAYVQAGYKKTKEMGAIRFSMLDRLVLTPMEINPAMKKFPWVAGGILLFFGLQPQGLLFEQAWFNGLPFLVLALLAVLAGALVTPVLLPFVPFRSFAIKGWIMGVLSMSLALPFFGPVSTQDPILLSVVYLLFPALSSYLALQFTGATTFTGMSGVKKELKIGIPFYIGAVSVSLLLMIVFKLKEWGIV
ncbi:MAG: acetyl-CoA synthase subunit gamma [Nitrospirae bacterium]|nr:acetyl-CoA synthase subunit gamma [Nitrospirota bacterium]